LSDASIFRRPIAAHQQIRKAAPEDAPVIGTLLHAFNEEFDDPSPGADFVASRARVLIASDAAAFLLVGEPPVGIAMLRFRDSVWSEKPDAHLEELYVAPARRGQGLGRALLERVLDVARERGAGRIDLGTAVDDRAARALYESVGFTNFEQSDDQGTRMLFYERDL
jgi:ribosomal protein S18 acetylase RimI-like enzyme